ncbi:MAG: hypothetical protein WCO06_01635 [Candidatus Roizmanbacteria bacterium]
MKKVMNSKILIEQGIPLILTLVIFGILSLGVYLLILVLNQFSGEDVVMQIRSVDVIVGMTIYLKTSVDFAIYIGNLMRLYPGWKNRIAIEIGTALGNALGTMSIMVIWNFFREVKILLAMMIVIAALVLLRMAEEGYEHVLENKKGVPEKLGKFVKVQLKYLTITNRIFSPILRYILPQMNMKTAIHKTFWGLFIASFSVPFILGLDDFAGYVSLFNVVNVLGFAVGVLLGHMILNIFLFISPKRTVAIVQNSYIAYIGSMAFILLAIWGLYEAIKIILGH